MAAQNHLNYLSATHGGKSMIITVKCILYTDIKLFMKHIMIWIYHLVPKHVKQKKTQAKDFVY